MIYSLTVPFGCSAVFTPDTAYQKAAVNGREVSRSALSQMRFDCGTYEIVTE